MISRRMSHAITRLAAALLLIMSLAHPASAADVEGSRWQVVEIAFEADAVPDDPFALDLTAVFAGPGGGRVEAPAFYNGGREYLVRFCPPTAGTWRYTTTSDRPDLAGRTGTIEVAEAADGDRGPVGVDPDNPRRFAYADGTPYFVMAFECDWLFALDAENPDDIPLTRQIAGEVADHGFNQVVMNVFAYDAGWGEKDRMDPQHLYNRPSVFPFGGDNEAPDHSTLDVEYFKRLDRVIEHLDERDVVAHLMIYVWNKRVSWPEAESEADDRYFDYVVKRYQAYPNLVWDISKEALAYGRDDLGYITRRIDRLRRFDGHDRLVTVHDYDYCSAFPDKVDFISIQEWSPDLYGRMLDVAAEHPGKPVYNIEHGGYERTMPFGVFDGAYNDPLACLDRFLQCVFAGTYATYYWQNAAWYHVVPDPASLPEEQRPNFDWYKHVASLFDRYDFNSLSPRPRPFAPTLLTDGEGLYLFYVGRDRRGIYGALPELKGRTMSVRWLDPMTGEWVDAGEKEFNNGWMGIERPEGLAGPVAVVVLEEVK